MRDLIGIEDFSKEEIDELIDITRSIEGQLIYYKKVKEQKKAIQLIYKIIIWDKIYDIYKIKK